MRICALCNGLQEPAVCCPSCGEAMLDGGPVVDYFGPYSPYMSRDSLASSSCCEHLLYCANCGIDVRVCAPEQEI